MFVNKLVNVCLARYLYMSMMIIYCCRIQFFKLNNMVTKFKNYLVKTDLAKNTVESYVWTVQYFLGHYEKINRKNLLAYKGFLVENYKPQTINLRLQGINKYLELIN